jgi:hypothetical protein
MARKSIKHLQIDKAQTNMLMVIAIATIVVVFGLFATKALVSKGLYQRRALHARKQVVDQLKANVNAANSLFTQYKVFANQDPNVLGGAKDGTASLDGDNPRIILDALPSKYDAPALASSIEKILTDENIKINSLTVTDDPATNTDKPEAKPTSKPIVFSFSGSSTYAGITKLLQTFEKSIRPFDINNLQISGSDKNLQVTANVTTYYQPAKSLDLTATKVVK